MMRIVCCSTLPEAPQPTSNQAPRTRQRCPYASARAPSCSTSEPVWGHTLSLAPAAARGSPSRPSQHAGGSARNEGEGGHIPMDNGTCAHRCLGPNGRGCDTNGPGLDGAAPAFSRSASVFSAPSGVTAGGKNIVGQHHSLANKYPPLPHPGIVLQRIVLDLAVVARRGTGTYVGPWPMTQFSPPVRTPGPVPNDTLLSLPLRPIPQPHRQWLQLCSHVAPSWPATASAIEVYRDPNRVSPHVVHIQKLIRVPVRAAE